MKTLLLSLLLLSSIQASAQTPEVIQIEFQSLSRVYFEKVTITKDSLIIKKQEGRGEPEMVVKKVISKKKWKCLMKQLATIDLQQIPELPAPSKKRTYDGARHSTLSIITASETYEHLFDNENPNQQLTKLMNTINDLTK